LGSWRPAIFNFVVVQFFFLKKSNCRPVYHINIYGAYFVKNECFYNKFTCRPVFSLYPA